MPAGKDPESKIGKFFIILKKIVPKPESSLGGFEFEDDFIIFGLSDP